MPVTDACCPALSSGSILGAALSLAVTTMGAGILTLPSAYADAGIIPATAVLVFVAYLTVFSVDFIVISVEKLGLNSYEEITRELLGRKSEEIVRWMLLVYNTGAAVGYLIVIGDLFEPLQPLITSYIPFLTTPKHVLLVFWGCFIMPMSCIPKLGALHITSFLAIFSTCVITAMIVFRYFVPGPVYNAKTGNTELKVDRSGALWWWGIHPLLALPIMMYSFDCQSLVFQIYAGLDNMRRSTMMKVSTISLIVTGTIHAAVGLFGYLTNPTDVRENIISNYDPNVDKLFAVGYVLYAIPINLAFVLLLFPIRDSIFILWYGYSSASVATHVPRRKDFTRIVEKEERLERLSEVGGVDFDTQSEQQYLLERKKHHNDVETIPLRDHLIVTICLNTLCIFAALITPGIVAVVSVLGGLCSSTLCFTVPALYRLRLHILGNAPCRSFIEWMNLVTMLAFGVGGGAFGTFVAVKATLTELG